MIKEYFSEKVIKSNIDQNKIISDELEVYLIDLLSNKFYKKSDLNYLFDLYNKALSSKNPVEKKNNFKFLGDYSLFMSGYFFKSILKSGQDIKYYIRMGSGAYSMLEGDIYKGLSDKYISCISVLNQVYFLENQIFHEDFSDIYSLWKVTESIYLKNEMLKLGYIPVFMEV